MKVSGTAAQEAGERPALQVVFKEDEFDRIGGRDRQL
jgi:hypothetical protein